MYRGIYSEVVKGLWGMCFGRQNWEGIWIKGEKRRSSVRFWGSELMLVGICLGKVVRGVGSGVMEGSGGKWGIWAGKCYVVLNTRLCGVGNERCSIVNDNIYGIGLGFDDWGWRR